MIKQNKNHPSRSIKLLLYINRLQGQDKKTKIQIPSTQNREQEL